MAHARALLDRRRFVASLGAAGMLPALPALAQNVETTVPFGSPSGTSPFPPEVYRERRRKLMEQMNGGVGLVYGATGMSEGAVAEVPAQLGDFAYLTGIQDEAGAVLVLAPQERTYKEFLFLTPRNPETEHFEGVRLPIGEDVRARTGFARVSRTSGLGSSVESLVARAPSKQLHFLGPVVGPDTPVPPALALYGQIAARVPGVSIVNSATLIRDMRAVKEARELDLMRRAIAATERGLAAGMRAARPGMRERELKALIEREFRAGGADGLAFPSIVGTGRASAVLHYTGNDGIIGPGALVLCDVGAAVGGYCADITRTFPVSGRFLPEQRQVYETVLAAQEAAVRTLRAGSYYEDTQAAADAVIRKAGHLDDFWHGLGHFVGLEVHDVGSLAAPLPAGAVVTVEPGIYLPERGFGVRIEDDYLITASGSDHLTPGVPRRAQDIEAFLAQR